MVHGNGQTSMKPPPESEELPLEGTSRNSVFFCHLHHFLYIHCSSSSAISGCCASATRPNLSSLSHSLLYSHCQKKPIDITALNSTILDKHESNLCHSLSQSLKLHSLAPRTATHLSILAKSRVIILDQWKHYHDHGQQPAGYRLLDHPSHNQRPSSHQDRPLCVLWLHWIDERDNPQQRHFHPQLCVRKLHWIDEGLLHGKCTYPRKRCFL